MFWQDRSRFQRNRRCPTAHPPSAVRCPHQGLPRERSSPRMPDRLAPAGHTTTSMTARNRARVAFGTLCAVLSDLAVMAVPTRTDHYDSPLAAIETARRGKLICQTMQFYAVVKALE